MSEPAHEDIVSIKRSLAAINTQHLSAQDLTKLLYIRGLITKAAQNEHKNQLAEKLIAKAYQALSKLECALEQHRANAKAQLALIEEDYEQVFEQAKVLFHTHSYRALSSLLKTAQKKESRYYFKDLVGEMQRSELHVRSYNAVEPVQQSTINKTKQADLQSFKEYQAMFEKMALERLLTRVMKEIPENAGPLNPERLVIRSFKALQDIAPEYLSRLISYYESLLTLQLLSNAHK